MEKVNLNTYVKDVCFGWYNERIQDFLRCYNVETLRQLVAISRTGICDMRNMGAKSKTTIKNWLEARGLHLGMTKEEIAEYEGVSLKTEEEKEEVLFSDSKGNVLRPSDNDSNPFISDGMKCEIYRFAANLILERSKIKEKYPSCLDTLEATIAATALYSEITKGLKKLKE